MAVVIVLIQKQKTNLLSSSEEIQENQKNILKLVATNDQLRSEILAWKAEKTNEKIKPLVPQGYNYSIELCPFDEICSLNFSVPSSVYSEETLILANLTYYNASSAVKVKLFFWRGPFPAGFSQRNYSVAFEH